MSVSLGDKIICKYNLRGMCRFGKRCRNVHENPEKLMEMLVVNKAPSTSQPLIDTQQEGACALSPTKSKSTPGRSTLQTKTDIFGPSTSSIESYSLFHTKELEEKTCGICFDVVLKKVNPFEQNFGLLPNCNHCFCFTCITKWRQSKEFDFDVSKSCPECRVASNFVYRTRIWLENKEKDAYINDKKLIMKTLDCKYFQRGRGTCPFGNTCLYLHALPNGDILDVGPPKPRRRHQGGSGDDFVHQIVFWLNDSDIDLDSESDLDSDFDLDLDDPYIAHQFFEQDDIRRYIALDQMLGCDNED